MNCNQGRGGGGWNLTEGRKISGRGISRDIGNKTSTKTLRSRTREGEREDRVATTFRREKKVQKVGIWNGN